MYLKYGNEPVRSKNSLYVIYKTSNVAKNSSVTLWNSILLIITKVTVSAETNTLQPLKFLLTCLISTKKAKNAYVLMYYHSWIIFIKGYKVISDENVHEK
jgi:hypothetical protein